MAIQKLSGRRLTDTPTDIPHVRGNCGLSLNREETLSETGLATPDNNPDAALTPKGENMKVYVLNHKGRPLMPCSPRKARVLLKQGKVKVVRRTPFTVMWIVPTRSYTQEVSLGVDSGYSHIGLSAVSEKDELYASEVTLRTDIVKLNSERREYRRARRNRKTWYRKPRFLNRKKPEGWLAPSIQHKLDSHIKLISQVRAILPVKSIHVEVAAFDIQKIKNPAIEGEQYQQGDQSGFWNTREYVLYRDGHTCQHCKGKSKDKVLEVHHIVSRQIGGDRPGNLITLCSTCHGKVSRGEIKPVFKASKGFRAEMFMSMVRRRLVNALRNIGYAVGVSYGYITKKRRIESGLSKSHINDAFVIAGGNGQARLSECLFIKQVRKCNRKLFKGERSHIRNTAERFIHGFQRFDKVLWKGIECFIFGRRTSGYFEIRKLDGTKLNSSAKHTELRLLEKAKTLLTERRQVLLSSLTEGVSEPVF